MHTSCEVLHQSEPATHNPSCLSLPQGRWCRQCLPQACLVSEHFGAIWNLHTYSQKVFPADWGWKDEFLLMRCKMLVTPCSPPHQRCNDETHRTYYEAGEGRWLKRRGIGYHLFVSSMLALQLWHRRWGVVGKSAIEMLIGEVWPQEQIHVTTADEPCCLSVFCLAWGHRSSGTF